MCNEASLPLSLPTASAACGQTVTSSPAGIQGGVGSSAQASFASGTNITLSVSGGRSAVWSGGNKKSSCTFTLNAAATVTANVQ
jgi:hypothetical protein